jgi:hypothetical protein
MASRLFCSFREAMARFGIVSESGNSDVGGGWKVGCVEEVKYRTKDTTLVDSCVNWK